MTVEALHEVESEPDAEIVERLERILSLAKDGQVRGFAIAMFMKGDVTAEWTCLGEGAHVLSMLGALRILEREFIDLHIDLTCRDAGEGRRDT